MLSTIFNKGQVNDLVDAAMRSNRREEEAMAIYFEIADWVNSQKRSGAARLTEILLPKINSRGERNALIALEILDICVKNCGFPFHLHICSIPFLREFTKSLPEKFPAPLTPVHQKILELLEFWKNSLYDFSRFKSDLSGIEIVYFEMVDKGFRFPKVKVDPRLISVRLPLRTENDLFEEDSKVQAAKLDEYLRRGTPADLAAANDLMKAMASHEFEKRPHYEEFVGFQIKNLEKECQMTLDLMNSLNKFSDPTIHPRLQEMLSYLKSSHLKVKKEILEVDDDKKTGPLLFLNDLLNSVFVRYEEVKADFLLNENNFVYKLRLQESLSAIPQGNYENPFQDQNPPKPQSEVSLIDLDFEPPQAPPLQSQPSFPTTFTSIPPPQIPFQSPLVLTPLPLQPPFQQRPSGGAATSSGAPSFKVASVFNQKGLEIQMRFETPQAAPDTIKITARYLNHLNVPLTELSSQFAVPKVMKIKTDNVVGGTLAPLSMGGQAISQQVFIHNPSSAPLRIRFRLSFKASGNLVSEEGELSNVPIFW